MRKLALITAASVLAIGGASLAVAKHHRGGGHGMMHLAMQADADGDGVITLAEVKAKSGERFAKMDANGDGQISREDRKAAAEARFAEADTNGDGELTPEEMTAAREARAAERAENRAERGAQRQAMMFERLDADESGTLSQEEMAKAREMRGERGERRGGERGERGERMGRRGAEKRGGGRRGMAMLRRADTNNDDAVSRAEFDAAIEARFAKLDTDSSGTITEAERAAMKDARKGRRGGERGTGGGSGAGTGASQ
ncbi:MAG: hypothetical protein AAF127_06620 [Pseudomonadota bacterium]